MRVRVLVGEPLLTSGSIWKAAGLRLAYVAHHAFHHPEKHMQETPTQYIMWCFAGNDGKESLEFKSDELSVDEESARSVKWCIDGVTGSVRPCTDPKSDAKKAKADVAGAVVPEATVSRRQKKKEKTYEYEVKWQFKLIETNVWVEKDILFKKWRGGKSCLPSWERVQYRRQLADLEEEAPQDVLSIIFAVKAATRSADKRLRGPCALGGIEGARCRCQRCLGEALGRRK